MATGFYSPWVDWCTNSTAVDWGTSNNSTAVTITATSDAWIEWVGDGTAGTAATTWLTWANSGTTAIITGNAVRVRAYEDVRTPAQCAADDARHAAERAETQRRADARLAETKAATARARRLLLSMLDVRQREQLQRDHFFEVIAKGSRRRYRIRQGTHGNVRLVDDQGREVTRYCAQPSGVPAEDAMLAQKLQLEHDEDAFLKVANATPLNPARSQDAA